MATHVNSTFAEASGGSTSLATTTPLSYNAGDVITILAKNEGGAATVSITDSAGNTWPVAKWTVVNTSSGNDMVINQFYLIAPSAGTNVTFTAHWASSRTFRRIYVDIGRPASGATFVYDNGATGQGSNNAPSTGAFAVAGIGGYAVAQFGEFSSVTWTAGAGWTADNHSSSFGEYRALTTESSITGNCSVSAAMSWSGAAVAFKETGLTPDVASPQPNGHCYPTTQNLSCVTDTPSGTLYVVLDTVANITGITAAQVVAGENNASAAAAFSGNATVANANPFVTIAGLTGGTTYGYAIVQQHSAHNSLVLTGSITPSSTPLAIPLVFQHIGGGGNPFSRGQSGNNFKIPLPEPTGPGNCYVLAFTADGGATVSSVTGIINGSLGAAVETALPGAGFLDTHAYVLPGVAAVTFSAGISSGATSATLASAWAGGTGSLVIEFSDGERRNCSVTNGSTSVTWSTALAGTVSANARAQEVITVTFGANVTSFQSVVTELFGIAASGAVAGHHSVANSTTIGAGSFTPTDNDATGGNLIWSYFVKCVETPAHTTTAITAGSGALLLNADVGWNNAADSMTKACQAQIQSTAASINPSVSSASDSGDGWNSIAIALKIDIAAGTPPPAKMRVNKVDHFSTEHYPGSGTYSLQVPGIGNLAAIMCTDPALHATSVTDDDGNTWTEDAAGSQIWYLKNASPKPTRTLSIVGGGADATLSWRYIDFSGAANDPFDSAVFSNLAFGAVSSITISPSPSPTVAPGFVVANIELGQGPGLAVTSPDGAFWDLVTYTGEVDTDEIENADIMAHMPYDAPGSQSWVFSITPIAGNSTNGGLAAFRAATAGPAISAATPSGSVAGTTQSIGCTTDAASGTLYVVVDTIDNILGVTAAQIVAGQNQGGSAAAFSGSGAVSSASPSVSVAGLSAGTSYGYAIAQLDAANSNVLWGTFTTTGGTVSGSAAISESADVASGAGAPSASGAGAATEGADAVSGAGALATAGSATIVEGSDAASGAGALSTSGSAAIAEGADHASGAGVAGSAGAAAIAESADFVAASGGLATSGSAAINEGADIASGTGALSTSGAAAILESADTASGSGTAAIGASGAAAITDSADIAAGSGTLATSGSAAITEASDAAAGAGAPATSGSASIVEAQDSASGIGTAGNAAAGSASITEGADAASGTGAAASSGSAAIAEGADAAAGSGSTATSASGAAPEQSDVAAGVGLAGSIIVIGDVFSVAARASAFKAAARQSFKATRH